MLQVGKNMTLLVQKNREGSKKIVKALMIRPFQWRNFFCDFPNRFNRGVELEKVWDKQCKKIEKEVKKEGGGGELQKGNLFFSKF